MQELTPDERLSLLKLRIYRLLIGLGVLATVTLWILSIIASRMTGLDYVIFPIATGFCLLSWFLFHKFSTRYVFFFERGVFAIIFIYFLSQFLLAAWQGIFQPKLDFGANLLWFPLVYVCAFLFFSWRSALRLSLAFLGCIFVAGSLYFAATFKRTTGWDNVLMIVQAYGSSLIYIVMLHLIAILKDRYYQAESHSLLMTSLAMLDPLTGIHNRRKIDDMLDLFIEQSERTGQSFSLIMLDVDRFKGINDTYGHDVGDYVLKRVVELIRANIRDRDCFGRWGGDEFVILYPATEADAVLHLAQRLERIVSLSSFEHVGQVSFSFGTATYVPGDTAERLWKRADGLLLAAKREKLPVLN